MFRSAARCETSGGALCRVLHRLRYRTGMAVSSTLGSGPNVGSHASCLVPRSGHPERAHDPACRCLPRDAADCRAAGRAGEAHTPDAPAHGRPTTVCVLIDLSGSDRRAAVETFRSPLTCGVRCRLLRGGGGARACRSRGCGRAADCGRCSCDAAGVLSACRPNHSSFRRLGGHFGPV